MEGRGISWILDREQQIIARTRDALLKEVEKRSRAKRVMSMWVEEIVEDMRDIRCDRCREEGRVPEREHELWSRDPSIDKDESRKLTEEVRHEAEHLRREEQGAGVQVFDESRLTKLINAGGSTSYGRRAAEPSGNRSRFLRTETRAC